VPASFDVFLSYPHKDQESVRALASVLKAEGLTVWMDELNVEAFDRIHDRVALGIASSRVALAWYSRSYANSRPCQWELSAAWLCNDGERVLVVNPEADDGHIQPRSLLNRLYLGSGDFPAIARAVKNHIACSASSPIGDSVSFRQPMHYGRQLTGSNHFVGRIPKLWELHDALSKSGAAMLTGTTRSVAQLRGLGGLGKSVLAEEYALRFGAAYPGGIFWLNAYGNDVDRLSMQPKDYDDERDRQISVFASQLNIPIHGKQPAEIRAALGQLLGSDRRSLWIVDDAPSGITADAFAQWLSPHANVPTLITTRDRSHSSVGVLVDVDVLSCDESFALFEAHRRIAADERNAVQELLDDLGHHALAIEVAASYLADQQSESIAGFLDDLRNPGEDVLEQAAELADALPLGHSPSIVATLNGTISRLSETARDLLGLASLLAAAPIPKELIEAVFARLVDPGSAKSARMRAAKETDRYGLSRKEIHPPDALSVHTLLARTARRHSGAKDRIERIRAAAVGSLIDMLRSMFSLGAILRGNLVITHARAVSASLDTAADAALLVLVANTDLNRGDLASADRLSRRAFEYCSRAFGGDALETCCARSGVAMVLLARGDSAAAREILEAVGPVFERSLPPGDVYRIGAQIALPLALAAQGDLVSARHLAEAALAACNDANGTDHPLTLNAKTVLGQILLAQGTVSEGARLQQEVIDARLRLADKADVDTLTDEFVMAQTRIADGDIESVAPIIEKAATAFEQALGEDNVLTLNAKLSLLLLHGQRRDAEAARRLANAVVPRFERLFGARNPATLRARLADAGASLISGDSAAAQPLLERLVGDLETMLGPRDADVLGAKVVLAQAHFANGDFEGSRRILVAIIPIVEACLGPGHPCTLNAKTCLAPCLSEQGEHADACKLWEEISAAREKLLGPDHPEVLNTRILWAQASCTMQQYQRSSELMSEVIPLAEARLGPDNATTLNAKGCLAFALFNLGARADTPSNWQEVMAVGTRYLKPSDPELLRLKLAFAQALYRMQDYIRSRDVMLETVPLAERTLGAENEVTRNAKICLASALHAMGEHKEASTYWEQLLAVEGRTLGTTNPQTIATARCLFVARWKSGDVPACRQIFVDYFQSFCHSDPEALSPLERDIQSDILQNTDWLTERPPAGR